MGFDKIPSLLDNGLLHVQHVRLHAVELGVELDRGVGAG